MKQNKFAFIIFFTYLCINKKEQKQLKHKAMKTYEISNNVIEFLTAMNFDSEDINEVSEYEERDPHHTLLLTVSEDNSTIAVTPSDAVVYFYILDNESNSEIISSTMNDIQKFIDNNSLIAFEN